MYRGRVERDFALWVDKGLIDRAAADAMLRELDERESSFSAGRVLLILAALLVAAAILLLVASNWEALPRIARAGGLIALIWCFYGWAAVLSARGAKALAAALLVLGTMTFGGAISLIGQMYHLSGDYLTVFLLWFLMAWVAALLFRSGAVTVIAGFLSWAFFAVFLEENDALWDGFWAWGPPLMALAIIGLVYHTGAARARHLAYLLMTGWLTWLYFLDERLATALALTLAGFIGFLAAAAPVSPLHPLARRAGAAPAFYTFLLAIIGLALLHAQFDEMPGRLALGIATLAVAVIGIALCGRDNGAVRYLGYLAFAAEILFLSFETVGTILGTSGFFLLSGVIVAMVAWIVIALEKRLSHPATEARP